MSGYSIQRDIVLRGDCASLVHQKDFHRRLELLFDVHVNVSTIENHHSKLQLYKDRSEGGELIVESEKSNGWVTVRGKSEEDCLKTQRYVLASSKPERTVLVQCGPQLLKLLFEDSPALRDAIEREYEVVVIAALKEGGLYIHGSETSVKAAVCRVDRLVDTIPCPPKHYDRTISQVPGPHLLPNLESDRNLIIRDATCVSGSTPHTNTLHYEHTRHQMNYLQDAKLHKRINQYVQLGFPVEQVQGVIESLGFGASDNDVMSRLVLVNSTKPTPPPVVCKKEGLRPIVIDGSNVAMKHGNGKVFSCRGIEIALRYFLERGHSEVTIFVPQWRKEPSRPETPIKDQEILFQLENAEYIKFTPSRRFGNRKIVCYDDRFIVQLADDKGGIIVSDDNFRDLFDENPSWRETIEKRVLQFVFVEDSFMVPQDPLGKHGPRLDAFLRFERGMSPNRESSSDQHVIPKDKTPCPYKEKCTFGPRCRYYHPERETKQREKESQEDSTSSPRDSPWSKDQQQGDELASRLSQLNIQTSPQKVVHTHPIPHERPGGLQNHHHTHPLIGHSSSSSTMERESNLSFSHVSHGQWGGGGGRSREEVMGTMARGSDRHFEKLDISYHNYPNTPPLAMSPSRYNHSGFQHVRPHSRTHPPPLVSPHLHPDYHHSHYSLQHPLQHSNEIQGYNVRPHSANTVGYSTSYYKDPRELDQIQSLDHNQKLVYEKGVEMFPQHRDRVLALIIQFHISDIHTLIKALGK